MEKDYYKILGVEDNSNIDVITVLHLFLLIFFIVRKHIINLHLSIIRIRTEKIQKLLWKNFI
jgi:hypothetical protein